MAAAVSKSIILRDLLTKTRAEVEEIKAAASTVIYGVTSSISALSNSATYSREDAAIILEACNDALAAMDAGPGSASPPPSTLGHAMRFQPVANPPGVMWGC